MLPLLGCGIMKEIDFLPEWYKSGRRLRVTYRTQYIVIICLFAVMVVWSFVTGASLSKAEAEIPHLVINQNAEAEEKALQGFNEAKSDLADLQKQTDALEAIDSRIVVSNILAELSFLIDRRVVLSKLSIKAEGIRDKNEAGLPSGSTAHRAWAGRSGRIAPPAGDIRYRVVISGAAADAANAAELVCKLEDSPYFCQVIPGFSRNEKIKDYQVTQFEISCYIANYIEER